MYKYTSFSIFVFSSVNSMLYEISCYVGARYKRTRLYFVLLYPIGTVVTFTN